VKVLNHFIKGSSSLAAKLQIFLMMMSSKSFRNIGCDGSRYADHLIFQSELFFRWQ
jgi:hypothetical protein